MHRVEQAILQMKRYLIKEFSFSYTPVQNEIVISIELGRETRIIEEDGRKNCLLALTLTAFGRADETDYLTIKASMEGVFECQETLEEKALEKMVAESGTSILLPVLRAAILSFTGQAGLTPPIVIPLMNPRFSSEAEKK
ncbi:preprotein translocase subunit SecB [Mesotoga sp. SC_NapDC2]|uniref:protein-export chaperone SecB n=2 Tax=Mesotoga TaxID=1184396 RepID=UPI000CA6BAC9|nr:MULTISPECIES: protein-export chaperone SecB [unclassified Mesotoga]PNQ05825.1 preprotein translocase subunit SecB [Mesotoga sp. SC_NapDC3]PXF33852.1 preprotein translocase subunit SecB [Mesotoga sp. SC_NapDC]RAM59773.1 preprotein translocase subunit SecB [Mesotoga sp. SC_4PWA21]RIZ60940.1 preprotein translocase subunit SecB [Mesotoga sp. SC_NapDC2]